MRSKRFWCSWFQVWIRDISLIITPCLSDCDFSAKEDFEAKNLERREIRKSSTVCIRCAFEYFWSDLMNKILIYDWNWNEIDMQNAEDKINSILTCKTLKMNRSMLRSESSQKEQSIYLIRNRFAWKNEFWNFDDLRRQ